MKRSHYFFSNLFLGTLGLVALNSSFSYGEASQNERSYADLKNSSLTGSTGSHYEPLSSWRIFGGFATGYGRVSGNEYSSSPDGTQVLFSGLVSYQIPKWVFDAGASWAYSNISGANSQNLPISIRTRMGLLDISPRYRLSQRWQLGPVVNFAFGSDTSYGPVVGGSVGSVLGGAKVVYEIPYEKFPVRLWSQVSTDLSISDRQFTTALVGVQIGIPIYVRHRDPDAPQRLVSDSVPLRTQRSVPLRIFLDPKKVFFSTNSTQLRPEVADILKDAGDYLEKHPGNWEKLEISGHADRRGRYEYNLALSKKRASTVQKALVQTPILKTKIHTLGLSYSQPIDPNHNAEAWALNRRVELVFYNVKQPEVLIEKLKPLTSQKPWDKNKEVQ